MSECEPAYHGVDFSGAKNYRRKVWVATQLGDGPATARSGFSHWELVEHIGRSADDGRSHYWLIDAPLSLATEQLGKHGIQQTWRAATEWLASFGSAREWRRACRAVSRVEPKRRVDKRFKTPMAPSNIRLFKQTWHAIVSVLLPLRAHADVLVLPMTLAERCTAGDEPMRALECSRVWLGEGCPTSTLRSRGWPHSGYKGPSKTNREQRQRLLRRLVEDDGVAVAPGAAAHAIDDGEGDALDSLLLLPPARRFSRFDHVSLLSDDEWAAVEGWVYV